jgi:hypothetical protein
MKTIPFSYHLYHRPTKKHYYGVKYESGFSPDDLWVRYFSSSKIVKALISEYGKDSFDITVRKTFETGEQAILWEHRVLTRLKAAQRLDWINRHNGNKKFHWSEPHSEKTKQKLKSKITGLKRSEQTKQKMHDAAIIREEQKRLVGYKMPISAVEKAKKTIKERRESGEINPYSEERNNKMAKSKTGTKRYYLPNGSFKMIKI